MALYIRVPLGPDGIVVTHGKMEIVDSRADATEVVYGHADFLQRRAAEKWTDLFWQIEKVSERKYVVRGDARKA
jgi:hypothetical protein